MTEFDDVIRRLENGRPEATARELDEIKQRVRRRAANPSRRSESMKSRLAILTMLVAGMVFSTAGAGLAVSSLQSPQNDASVAQYATPQGGVLPAEEENAPEEGAVAGEEAETGAGAGAPESGEVLGANESGGVTQPTRQAAAQSTTSQLPLTGFAAIPVLIAGLALLTGGLLLRRRAREQ